MNISLESALNIHNKHKKESYTEVGKEITEDDDGIDLKSKWLTNSCKIYQTSPHYEASADDWMSSFLEWSSKQWEKENKEKHKKENKIEQEKYTADEHTTVFQDSFLEGDGLKFEVVEAITELEGVLSVGWGFSDEKGQTMPVIRISADKESNTKELLDQTTTTLFDKVFERKRLKHSEIQAFLKIVKSGKPAILNFESPGNAFQTTYDPHYQTTGTFTGYIHAQMELRLDGQQHRRVDSFYPFVPLHCVLPARNPYFQQRIGQFVIGGHHGTNVKELRDQTIPYDHQVPKLQHIHDQFQMPAMLRTTLYPQETKRLMREMEGAAFHLTYTVNPGQRLPGYLAGKTGLIEHKKNKKSYACIVNIPEYSSSKDGYPSFFTHPCNMDIAVLKPLSYLNVNLESYSNVIKKHDQDAYLLHEPAIRLDGRLIAIIHGQFVELSSFVSSYEFWIERRRFPCIQWTIDEEKDEQLQQLIDNGKPISGSPVFVQSTITGSFTFIGGMYSKKTAFSADFALKLMQPEIIEHLITDDILSADRNEQQILMRLLQIAQHYKNQGITRWNEEIPIPILGIPQQGSVLCNLEYYTHSLP